jgi:hypothetical protein
VMDGGADLHNKIPFRLFDFRKSPSGFLFRYFYYKPFCKKSQILFFIP